MADAAQTPERGFTLSEFARELAPLGFWGGRRSNKEDGAALVLRVFLCSANLPGGLAPLGGWGGRRSSERDGDGAALVLRVFFAQLLNSRFSLPHCPLFG